jgi:hypothetical protein
MELVIRSRRRILTLLLGGTTLANYNPSTGAGFATSGGLPIQTPVSPDGKFVVSGNTLTATISVIDTSTDTPVAILPCSAGCYGVNFGAKKGGGYHAYVSSKYSNDLIVIDIDPTSSTHLKEVGRVLLVDEGDLNQDGKQNRFSDDSVALKDGYAGMGGQGVLPIPLVCNGWVQNLPPFWQGQLNNAQRYPFPSTEQNQQPIV